MTTPTSKWVRPVVGFAIGALGVAALVVAFLIWVGTGLDKQAFDAGTIATISALAFVGVLLVVVGWAFWRNRDSAP